MTETRDPAAEGPEAAPALGRTVLLLGVAAFASVATMRIADPLVPQIANEFQVSAGNAAIVSSAFTIAYAIGQFVYGPLGDRFGKLKLIALMAMISAFTVAASGLATSLHSIGLMRFLGGATAAAIVPLSMAFIGDHVAYEHRQTMLARMLSGTIFGGIFGQIFGGMIGEYIGWRAVFPLIGLIFLSISAFLFLELVSRRLPPPKLSASISVSSLIRGYAKLLGHPWARVILLAVFIEGFFFYGAFTFIGADLHQRFSLDYGTIGLILAFLGLGGLIYTLSVRHLVSVLGERGLALFGGSFMLLGMMSLPVIPLALIPVAQLLLGLGLSMLHNTLQTNATQMVPEARGLAVSTFANALFLGQAAGITASGFLVDRFGFAPSYIVAAAGLLILGVAFARLLERRP